MPVIFDEPRVSALALAWQQTEDAEGKARLWVEIVAESRNLLLSIICSYKWPLDTIGTSEEILSELTLRLHRLLRYFRPANGKFYSFLVRCSLNYLSTLRDRAWKYSTRFAVADLSSWDAHPALTVEPQVYSRPFEIREALDHYSRPDSDFECFLTRNLVLYAYQREGRRKPPTPEEITNVVAEICRLSPEDAQARTNEALELLRRELRDLGVGHFIADEPGRPAAANHCLSQRDSNQ